MNKLTTTTVFAFSALLLLFSSCTQKTINLADYGVMPTTETAENAAVLLSQAIEKVCATQKEGQHLTLRIPAGRYDFYPTGAAEREYYISNHDQVNPKRVGLALEGLKNITLDGQGSQFVFHGQMLPVSLVETENCTLQNFTIDFETPHITQATILSNNIESRTIVYELAPWVQYEVVDSTLVSYGEGWRYTPSAAIAFEGDTRRIVYNTSDIGVQTRKIYESAPRQITAEGWYNDKLKPGTVLAMRTWNRPTPGLFVADAKDTFLKNLTIHYCEGMGLLAQMSENITLDGFSIALKGDDDPRYFTAQADATHFSGCKGVIISRNGLYEAMMDDAINVHGTYLKVVKRIDDHTVIGRYMHGQCYGLRWGEVGDSVQFVRAQTMELTAQPNVIAAIEATDKPINKGVKEFTIRFENSLPEEVNTETTIGMENLTWTPEVIFEHNLIRNNRARGTLFSTPRRTVVQHNEFDHTSGTAILLCGDCNGWFETGACKDVLIRKNRFKNALTSMFQFTNAVISIYPEIPKLAAQEAYFHSGIVIEDNHFETFDAPILYAKSVDGLIFRNNTIVQNQDYPPFHWNKERFLLERVINFVQE